MSRGELLTYVIGGALLMFYLGFASAWWLRGRLVGEEEYVPPPPVPDDSAVAVALAMSKYRLREPATRN